MSEEKIYTDVIEEVTEEIATEEAVEEVIVEEVVEEPTVEPIAEKVVAKKGFAKAALVFGILAFITTLFLINYVFGILSLIVGIIYLVKKADVKPKGKAITGIVLASLSLIISTTIWVSAYMYIMKTDVSQIITDVGTLVGEEINGEEVLNQTVAEMTGGAMTLDTIEEFVGGEVTVDRVVDFVGDVKEEEITGFINEVQTMDQETLAGIVAEFEGEVTYEKLEEKLGKDFSLKELMEYIRKFEK